VEKQENETPSKGNSRRSFLKHVGVAGAGITLAPLLSGAAPTDLQDVPAAPAEMAGVTLTVNGKTQTLNLDSRVTLLDALRNKLLAD